MKVNVSTLVEGKIYNLEEELIISGPFDSTYQLVSLNNIKVKADIALFEDILSIGLSIDGKARMISAYSLVEGDHKIRLKENLTFTFDENNEDEEMIFEKRNVINLDEYIRSIILASLPTKFTLKGETLPDSGSNYRVLSEEQFIEERRKKKTSPFDKLTNLDIDE